ncbi:MAG: hypothetical protein K0S23_1011 [Fluviicola sp.]|jgi:hypothetical protein|nr:hypothetical protein [Fluviicola sp.]
MFVSQMEIEFLHKDFVLKEMANGYNLDRSIGNVFFDFRHFICKLRFYTTK